jgi:hypothetical protein
MSSDHEASLTHAFSSPRPGAMTAVMLAARPMSTGPRELRIGRIEGGAIVEDRLYRSALTYGDSEKAALLVPDAGRRCATLFQRDAAGTFTLVVPEGARGRLALTAGAVDLAQVAGTSIPLDASARGKLILGTTTLLFQLVPPAGVALRPQLPSAARGGFASMIDWRFTSYVMASLCAHLLFVAWLDSADFALEADTTMLPEAVTRLMIDMPDPPTIPDPAQPSDHTPAVSELATNEVASTPSRASQPSREHATPTAQPSAADETARIAAVTNAAVNQAQQLLVGGAGDAAGGAFADLLRGSAVVANAQQVLDGVRSVGIPTGPAGALPLRSGGGTGSETGTLGQLAAQGGGTATQQLREGRHEVVEQIVRCPQCMTEPEDPIQQSGDRDPAEVLRLLRARRLAFQACYEQRTRVNPELAGKLGATFTISEMGTVSGVRVTENRTGDAPLALCVTAVFQRLRFGEVPGSGESTFAHAFVFAPQN